MELWLNKRDRNNQIIKYFRKGASAGYNIDWQLDHRYAYQDFGGNEINLEKYVDKAINFMKLFPKKISILVKLKTSSHRSNRIMEQMNMSGTIMKKLFYIRFMSNTISLVGWNYY